MIGETLSHYRVIGKLGQGGMGVVYRATDLDLGRTVALKFIPDEALDNPNARERFLREARVASQLDHVISPRREAGAFPFPAGRACHDDHPVMNDRARARQAP